VQSTSQLSGVSPPVQKPSPQVPQAVQSSAQLRQFSPSSTLHWPSMVQVSVHGPPQSSGQVAQVSLAAGSQVPSPQVVAHTPQSNGQLVQLSDAWHTVSGQVAHSPQSLAQLVQSSVASHAPSPQPSQNPQSAAQVVQSSSTAQVPSPHPGVTTMLSGAAASATPPAMASGGSPPAPGPLSCPHAAAVAAIKAITR
jgi:hypothetical protein